MRTAVVICDGTGSLDHPLILHALLTSRCNAHCPGCAYSGGNGMERNASWWCSTIEQFAQGGGRTLALGGGEPTLKDGLAEIVQCAKSAGLFVSLTTNGLSPMRLDGLDLVHVSCDSRHPLVGDAANMAIAFYESYVPTVGANIVLWGAEDVQIAQNRSEPTTVIMPKPWWVTEPRAHQLKQFLSTNPRIAADACMATWLNNRIPGTFRTPCLQGRVSMCIDSRGRASKCSHVPKYHRTRFETVADGWEAVRINEGVWEGGGSGLNACLRSWSGQR